MTCRLGPIVPNAPASDLGTGRIDSGSSELVRLAEIATINPVTRSPARPSCPRRLSDDGRLDSSDRGVSSKPALCGVAPSGLWMLIYVGECPGGHPFAVWATLRLR